MGTFVAIVSADLNAVTLPLAGYVVKGAKGLCTALFGEHE